MNTSHYPSLELCEKLTNIGFPKTENRIRISDDDWYNFDEDFWVCPSVMEMLDVMPQSVNWWVLSIHKDPEIWVCMYDKPFEQAEISSWDTLPNALAEMILWLKENNYLP